MERIACAASSTSTARYGSLSSVFRRRRLSVLWAGAHRNSTITTTAPRLEDADQAVAPSHFTRHVNYLGMCALALPTGLGASGLPTSMQIIARAGQEVRGRLR